MLVGGEPGGLSHAYFCSSGSEGMEAAIKLARQYFLEIGQPQRDQFIARRQGYHGNTLGALAAGGNMMRRAPVRAAAVAARSTLVSPCFPYRFKGERRDRRAVCAAASPTSWRPSSNASAPAAWRRSCAETVVGATTGCVAAVPGYFRAVREICDRHGALLILDEVMCGMGRTGTMHAWEQEGVAPDIEVIAKGLGGGYQPIGGILIQQAHRRGVAARLRQLSCTATPTRRIPVACAAALAVQQVIRDDNLLANVRAMGDAAG